MLLYRYLCTYCDLNLGLSGSPKYIALDDGTRVPYRDMWELQALTGMSPQEAHEKGRIGETSHCLCFTCLHKFDVDVHRDIKRCPRCGSLDVKSGRGAVGCTCPKCGKGTIHEEFAAFVNCRPVEEATTIDEAKERAVRLEKPKEPEKCIYCGGTGECFCKRRQWDDPDQCMRCEGTGRCHVCCGTGLMCRGTVA